MVMTDIYDSLREGIYSKFIEFYDNNINQINKYTKLNLLQTLLSEDNNIEDRLKIMKYLIEEGININYLGGKKQGNAMHTLYTSLKETNPTYLFQTTELLIKNGININEKDKFGAIPLQYLIAPSPYKTEELKELYIYLLKNEADYKSKDNYGNNCLDYANQFSWRNDFIKIVEEFENESK